MKLHEGEDKIIIDADLLQEYKDALEVLKSYKENKAVLSHYDRFNEEMTLYVEDVEIKRRLKSILSYYKMEWSSAENALDRAKEARYKELNKRIALEDLLKDEVYKRKAYAALFCITLATSVVEGIVLLLN